MRSRALLSLCTSLRNFIISVWSGGTILSMSMSEAVRTFSSSWLFTAASLSFISARSVSSSIRYFARSSLRPIHAPIGVATAATSADTMIVIISPLIHTLLFYSCGLEPCLHVEAGAGLGRKFIMPVHCRAGVPPEQLSDEPFKRCPLRCRARVLRGLPVGCAAAYVAHAYGVRIMAGAVRPRTLHGTAGMDASVTVNHIMVAYAVKFPLAVPPVYLGNRVVAPLRGRGAVQYYFRYRSHCSGMLRGLVADYGRTALGLTQGQADAVLLEVH